MASSRVCQELFLSASAMRLSVSCLDSLLDSSMKSMTSRSSFLDKALAGATMPRRVLLSIIVNSSGLGMVIA